MGIETKSKLLPKDENNNLEAPYGNWNSKKDIILSLFSHHLEAPYGNWNTVSIMLVFVVSSIDLEAPYGNWNISVMFSLFVFFSRFRSSLWELKLEEGYYTIVIFTPFRSSLWELKLENNIINWIPILDLEAPYGNWNGKKAKVAKWKRGI